jgi:aspartate aminotransferase
MNQAYRARHDYLYQALNKIPGFECLPSDGTFYSFPCIKKIFSMTSIHDDLGFAEFLLNQAEVAVIPGSAFGASQYIRLSFATSIDNLHQAVAQIKHAVALLIK